MAETWRRWLRYRPADERTRMLVDLVAEAAEDGEQGGDGEFVVDLARLDRDRGGWVAVSRLDLGAPAAAESGIAGHAAR